MQDKNLKHEKYEICHLDEPFLFFFLISNTWKKIKFHDNAYSETTERMILKS